MATPERMTRAKLEWPAMIKMGIPRALTRTGMVLHWDGGRRGMAVKPHEECVRYWQWCRKYHMDGHGWLDIGYSYGVCPHGGEFEGRTFGYQQAAQPGGNATWVSVTTMLGHGEMPTAAQIAGIQRLRQQLIAKGMHTGIRGHSQFISTDCPGPIIRDMITKGIFAKLPPREGK